MSDNKVFTRTIWILSFVSFFADIASEMLYPVMPLYLKTIGFTALWIGILEGVAEAVVGLSKGYFGQLSDERGQRLPFVKMGYLLSNIAKPLMAMFTSAFGILLIRSADRLGKGIRTGARDAMLSDECSVENKGKVFGLHRAMDTFGAALGPLLALAFLYYYPKQYQVLFLIAFIPGMIGVALTYLLSESPNTKARQPISKKRGLFSYLAYWKIAPAEYKKITLGMLVFALFNSSDIFLLLMAKNSGITDLQVIGVYVFYNLIYALFSLPLGSMADKIGMKPTFIIGLILFAVVYAGMASVDSLWMLYVLFFIYGIYAAATEGVSKAWIARLVPSSETATAIGFFASGTSIATLFSSSLAGFIWMSYNPAYTFVFTAIGVVGVIIYFLLLKSSTSTL